MTQWTLLALLGLVLFASNSTMRPINMCPEKFLPSCGTWRTIVTDRKVFAQVRIFSAHFFLVPALSRPLPQSAADRRRRLPPAAAARALFFTKNQAENLLQRTKNALGQQTDQLTLLLSLSLPSNGNTTHCLI